MLEPATKAAIPDYSVELVTREKMAIHDGIPTLIKALGDAVRTFCSCSDPDADLYFFPRFS